MIVDPRGDGVWSVTANFGRYTAGLASSLADSTSAAGNSATIQWTYRGPAINPDTSAPALVDTATAIQQVFDWCARDSRGFCTAAGAPVSSSVPGVSVKVGRGLVSPNVLAYGAGVSRQLSSRGVIRADYSYRDYRDFYAQRTDRSTGIVADEFGNRSDLAILENTNSLKRRYSGLTLSASYRVAGFASVGGHYTLSRLWGNFDGENAASGPIFADLSQYPEYRQAAWYAPEGDLAADQRHRARIWASIPAGLPHLTASVVQDLSSGAPYGAGGGNPAGQTGFSSSASVDVRPYVTNPGYVTPQGGARENYYYTARDAFRTEASKRTDLALNYTAPLGEGSRKAEVFLSAHLLNVLNKQDLCGCGGTVFANGGAVALNTVGSGVLAPPNSAAMAAFNPFTTTPVRGVNWNYNANFGTPLNRFAFTSPRTFRLSVGVRF